MVDPEYELAKDKTILNAINEINPGFFEWLTKILKGNTTRIVSVCTFLLNFNLQLN